MSVRAQRNPADQWAGRMGRLISGVASSIVAAMVKLICIPPTKVAELASSAPKTAGRAASRSEAACTCPLLSDEPQGRGCGGVCCHAIDGRAAVGSVLGVVGGIDARAQPGLVFADVLNADIDL